MPVVNTAPILTDLDSPVSFDESTVNAAPQLIDANVTFTDPDNNFVGGTLTVSGLLAEDSVAIRNQGTGAGQIGISGSDVTYGGIVIGTFTGGNGSSLTVTFDADATAAIIEALIENLTYANPSNTPTESRTLSIIVTDQAGGTTAVPSFLEQASGANPFNGINVGSVSTPTLGDVDGDGDLDAVVGNGNGILNYLENTGTATTPVYEMRTGAANPFDGIDVSDNYSYPTLADVDGDGDLDAVVGEQAGTLNYFENTGTATAPVYESRSGSESPFTGIYVGTGIEEGYNSTPSFSDLDGDGDLDMVVGEGEGTLNYFENIGTATAPDYEQRTGTANPFGSINAGIVSTPSFGDVDGDGDLDLVVGEQDGTLNYFENIGTATAPDYEQRTGTANPFDGINAGNVSTPTLADVDGDGDLDAVVGESGGVLNVFLNTLDNRVKISINEEPVLVDVDSPVSFSESQVNSAPQLIDADVTFTDTNDNYNGGTLTVSGLLAEDTVAIRKQGTGAGQIGVSGSDITYGGVVIGTFAGGIGGPLTVTFNSAATAAAIEALIQNLTYANASDTPTAERTLTIIVTDAAGATTAVPSFAERTGAANPFDGIAVGFYSTPTLADVDGDGDLDLVVGEADGILNYYQNTGTAAAPVYVAQSGTANPFDGIGVGAFSAPTLADVDGDGDLDLVVGENEGTLNYYQNTGTAAAPVYVAQTDADNPFDGIDVGIYSSPTLADVDGDGDLDLVVGEGFSSLKYFQNTGTAAAPVYVAQSGTANPFDGIGVGTFSAPTLADVDGDGDLDLVVGEGDGILNYYQNTGTAAAPVYVAQSGTANPFDGIGVGSFSAPTLADVDGDSDLDLVVGENDGNLNYVENTLDNRVKITVTAENDTPTLSGLNSTVTFTENAVNAAPQLLDADVAFTDGDFGGGTLTVAGLLAQDTVAIRNQGSAAGQIGISLANVSYGGVVIGTFAGGLGGTLTVTFNSTATAAAIEALIENLTYANSSDTPTATRTLEVNVTDADGAQTLRPAFAELTGAANPFNGIDVEFSAAPSLADLDGDGDLDLLVGNSFGELHYYQNTGSSALPAYVEQTDLANPFSGIDLGTYSTPSFADLDDDGDFDAVIGNQNGVLRYFRNTGSAAAPSFVEQTGVNNPFNGVDVGGFSAPTLADVDGDGDFDAVVTELTGATHYFENTGTTAAPVYIPWTGASNPFDSIHVGNYQSLALGDMDGDGDLDAVLGNLGSGFVSYLYYFENTGSATAANYVQRIGVSNPFNDLVVSNFPGLTLTDVDMDGDIDLVAGYANGTIHTFLNTPTPGVQITINVTAENDLPQLAGLRSSVTFAENTVNAAPQLLDADVTFTDSDNNFNGGTLTVSGLLAQDTVAIRNQGNAVGQIGISGNAISYGGAVIGSFTGGLGSTLNVTFDSNATAAAIDALIQNLTYANSSNTPTLNRTLTITVTDDDGAVTRDLARPSFAEATGTDNPFASVGVSYRSAPALADLDSDGDLDLVVADINGFLNYYRNEGSATNLSFVNVDFSDPSHPFGSFRVGSYSTLLLADVEGDGDLDLVAGEFDGVLNYYRNEGSATNPNFVNVNISDTSYPFPSIDVGTYSAPTLADVDSDGDLDLVVGEFDGVLNYYRNEGSATNPNFVNVNISDTSYPFASIAVGSQSTPTLADVDGDGDLDLVVGENLGVLNYYRNDGSATNPNFVYVDFSDPSHPFASFDVGSFSKPTLADVDGDGDLDLVVGGQDGTLTTYLNTPAAGVPIIVKVTAEVDTIIGTSKGETLNGTAGPDAILALGGNDRLNGGGGNDILNGGAGVDRMTGGLGADTFVFNALTDSGAGYSGYINNFTMGALSGAGQRDIITDFTRGVDKIDISGIDAHTGLVGNQAFHFLGTGNFTHTARDLIVKRYDVAGTASDKTIIYGDVNGDARADFQIELSGLKTLTAADFVL